MMPQTCEGVSVFELYVMDLDGTLVDTRRDIAEAVNNSLLRHGRSAAEMATVISWVGDGLDDMMARAFATDDSQFISELVTEFGEQYGQHCTDFSLPYDGCRETLTALRARGARCSVLTNKPQELSVEILRGLGLLEFFDHVIGPSEPSLRKPDPTNLLSLARGIGVAADHAIMVGDSRNDILVAQRAGIVSCGCTFGYVGRDVLASMGATFLIDSWPQLLTLESRPAN